MALSLRLVAAKALRRMGRLDEAETHFKVLAGERGGMRARACSSGCCSSSHAGRASKAVSRSMHQPASTCLGSLLSWVGGPRAPHTSHLQAG